MTAEAQRIAIAEACGWVQIYNANTMAAGGIWFGYPPKNAIVGKAQPIPDYLNDLNAMHEAEKVLLTGDRWQERLEHYSSKLMAVMEDADPVINVRFHGNRVGLRYYTVHATATQRAEAFLKTIGKWKE